MYILLKLELLCKISMLCCIEKTKYSFFNVYQNPYLCTCKLIYLTPTVCPICEPALLGAVGFDFYFKPKLVLCCANEYKTL